MSRFIALCFLASGLLTITACSSSGGGTGGSGSTTSTTTAGSTSSSGTTTATSTGTGGSGGGCYWKSAACVACKEMTCKCPAGFCQTNLTTFDDCVCASESAPDPKKAVGLCIATFTVDGDAAGYQGCTNICSECFKP